MEGEELRRSYSICSGPDDGELAHRGEEDRWRRVLLGFRRAERPGQTLDVMTPTGRFGVAPEPDEARRPMSALPAAPASRRSCRS
jgi:ring-1,2-phenylacetyl-CoA epoxidase subunit PaaE